ncbi:MAG: hypothetical protein B7Y47_03810 [Sphingomonas sp. 28-63-12]|nr:MAG: hypothetical protein B7Y47_03810 [Sphingomonas sp. 28-63-12]
MAILMAFGALFWFIAAMMLRALGPMGALDGSARAITFALVIPGTYPFALLIRRAAGLVGDQIIVGVGAITLVASFLDGVALSWFPAIYGDSPQQLAASGATILWGVFAGLVIAFPMAWTDRR